MTNFKKAILALTAGLLLWTPALAASCPHGEYTPQLESTLTESGATIKNVDQNLVDNMVKLHGNPPDTEGNFVIKRVSKDGKSQLIFVDSNSCITFFTPHVPAPDDAVDHFLGMLNG